MSRAIPLIPGSRLYAGASLPFIVSKSMVTNWLTARGFRNVVWHERDEALPTGIVPRLDPGYDDDWDLWATADYSGPTGSLEPPADPSWMRVVLPVAASTPQLPFAATAPALGQPGPLPALPATSSTTAPQSRSIVPDPVIVRRYRLGVAAAVFGGALALGAAAWGIFTRTPSKASEPPDSTDEP